MFETTFIFVYYFEDISLLIVSITYISQIIHIVAYNKLILIFKRSIGYIFSKNRIAILWPIFLASVIINIRFIIIIVLILFHHFLKHFCLFPSWHISRVVIIIIQINICIIVIVFIIEIDRSFITALSGIFNVYFFLLFSMSYYRRGFFGRIVVIQNLFCIFFLYIFLIFILMLPRGSIFVAMAFWIFL